MTTPHVVFVGAGPGAEDLITVRGLRHLEQADFIVYAGSLVNPAHLNHCKKQCVCLDSAAMTLEEQVTALSEAALAGKRVVRLHTGDPAIYGAINEQIRGLAEKGVASEIVPGVSSVFGAAAALGCELTCPDISQSVVLTRTPGRTPMPAGENAAAFARTGATLVFFLSAGNISGLMQDLLTDGGLSPDTPAAAVYRATWPDERILRGTIADLPRKVAEAGFGRQALIFVGHALSAAGENSRLYGADFSHGYRNQLPNERFEGRCGLYAFTDKGVTRAKEIAAGLGLPTVIHTSRPEEEGTVHLSGSAFDKTLAANWHAFKAHIFIGATGIAVRKIAHLLRDKKSDPAVVCCAETGRHVVSLTSGHLGGANRLARRIARITGGQAVVSTATDCNGLPAIDDIAAQENARILNANALRRFNAALLDGEAMAFCGSRAVFDRHFGATTQVGYVECPEKITTRYAILWDAEGTLPEGVAHLTLTSRAFTLGIGCRRGVDPEEVQFLAERYLSDFGLRREQIAAVASCDVKSDEPAILQLAETWNVPLRLYAAARLDAVPVPTPSALVREKIGTPSASEAAALLAAGYGTTSRPTLHAPKTAFGKITLALAKLAHLSENNASGKLIVVGLGSGTEGHITPEVAAAIRECDTVAGYRHYLDFIRDRIQEKNIIQNGMMGEVARCRAALEAAASGQSVCMVCSGDPGILAMAGLLYELRTRESAFSDVPITVLPGITAANIAAASLGAPLQNGFSLISLSDLLVPTDEVRRNLHAVARSALPVALYNPAGRKRRHLLEEALDIFRNQRGNEVLCAYVRHAGRPEEHKWIGPIAEFPLDEVDMSTLVLIGGPRTVLESGILYEARGYVEKYLEKN